MSSAMPWSPCPAADDRAPEDRVYPSYCWHSETIQQRVSASIIGARMADGMDMSRPKEIPLFSWDGGVILRPEAVKLKCMYGFDGSADYYTNPCGDPPMWCKRGDEQNGGCLCGFYQCGRNVQPWHPEDLDIALRVHAEQWYNNYRGFGTYSGYNEAVVDPGAWIANLPKSIEAIFYVEPTAAACSNKPVSHGQSKSCEEAERTARRVHEQILRHYDFEGSNAAAAPPLVVLDQSNWLNPFRDAPPV